MMSLRQDSYNLKPEGRQVFSVISRLDSNMTIVLSYNYSRHERHYTSGQRKIKIV